MHTLYQYLAPGDRVFDIGAHLGGKSGHLLDAEIEVVMVEPQPFCVQELLKQFNNVSQAHIVPMGVGKKCGSLKLSVNSNSPTISTFAPHWKTGRFKQSLWDSEVVVEITTLDCLIERFGQPRYIKVDVEGFEFEALNGLTKKAGIISFEFTSEFLVNAHQCVQYLRGLGYSKFNFSVGESPAFYLDRWHDPEGMFKVLRGVAENTLAWGDIYAN